MTQLQIHIVVMYEQKNVLLSFFIECFLFRWLSLHFIKLYEQIKTKLKIYECYGENKVLSYCI